LNPRERFITTLTFGSPDRIPYRDEEVRRETLDRWHGEGMPKDRDLMELFDLDRWEKVPLNLGMLPQFEGRLRSRRGFEKLKASYDPFDESRYPEDWAKRVERWSTRDYPLGIDVWPGFFRPLNVTGPSTLRELIVLMYREPELVAEMTEFIANFSIQTISRALSELDIDYAVVREPIADNNGPIISPTSFERFVIPAYRKIVEVLHDHSIDLIIFSAFGNVRKLIPLCLKAGINGLRCSGTKSSGVDYVSLRRKYGRELFLIGGLDVETLSRGKETIRKEIASKVPYLIESGGYVPTVDNRVRDNVSFQNYAFYRTLIRGMSEGRTDSRS
jgi:uroporphyrinogen decarboxylase